MDSIAANSITIARCEKIEVTIILQIRNKLQLTPSLVVRIPGFGAAVDS